MQYRKLGKSGLDVSELALGTMQFGWTTDQDNALAVMDAYLQAGGNLIDTADIYSRWVEGNPGGVAEEIIGRWMKARGNRHDVVLATKVRGRMWDGPDGEGLSRAHIMRAVEDSLRRLQTDYIDLYQAHFFDASTPIEETLRAMDDLVRSGKVRYTGCSNYPAWRLVEALWAGDRLGLVSYVSLQPHYNLVHREELERDTGDLVRSYNIGVISYSPLAGGFLTGKYRRGQASPTSARAPRIAQNYLTDRNLDLLDRMEAMARERSRTIPQIALAWLLGNPLVTAPIVGANTVSQLQESLGAVGLRLTTEERNVLSEMTEWRKS